MYHKVVVLGNLGQDPVTRFTANGQPVCNLSVATSNKYTDKNGQKHEETVWWKVAVWGKQAAPCQQYLTKGRTVYIEGRVGGTKTPTNNGGTVVTPTVFTRQDGTPAASYEMTANFVQFVGGANNGQPVGQQAPQPAADTDDWGDDDEIPF